jgi:hypothetical protein
VSKFGIAIVVSCMKLQRHAKGGSGASAVWSLMSGIHWTCDVFDLLVFDDLDGTENNVFNQCMKKERGPRLLKNERLQTGQDLRQVPGVGHGRTASEKSHRIV